MGDPTLERARLSGPVQSNERPRPSERGSIIVLVALSLVMLLGVVALAIDGSYVYTERNRLAAAADAGAKSAALSLRSNGASTNLQAYVDNALLAHGFDPAAVTSEVYSPPVSGPFSGAGIQNSGYVEVRLQKPTKTFFARVLDPVLDTLTPAVRAVAGSISGPICLLGLGPATGTNPVLDIAGTITIEMPTCEIAGNGNMAVGSGSGSINAKSTGVTGTCTGTCADVVTGAAVTKDPLAAMPEPTNPYSTKVAKWSSADSSAVIEPGWYGSITVANSQTINFRPGLYWIDGPFTIGQNANLGITGTGGVMFYLAGSSPVGICRDKPPSTAGCLNWNNSLTGTLRAESTGTYAGILFFQSRTNGLTANTGNSGNLDLYGALYFPAARLEYGNSGGATNDCMMMVARELKLGTGGGSADEYFANTCAGIAGNSPLMGVTIAE